MHSHVIYILWPHCAQELLRIIVCGMTPGISYDNLTLEIK